MGSRRTTKTPQPWLNDHPADGIGGRPMAKSPSSLAVSVCLREFAEADPGTTAKPDP